MTYNKPYNVRYVDMAIWIDENYQDPNCDPDTLYQYLYHLAIMLARKGKYFLYAADFDTFGLEVATKLFIRLRNIRKTTKELPEIKSILNYMKRTIYGAYSDYVKKWGEVAHPNIKNLTNQYMTHAISLQSFSKLEFNDYLKSVPYIIQQELKVLPQASNAEEYRNIYISCLATFLDSITLTEETKKKLEANRTLTNIEKFFKKERDNSPILYHLDYSYRDFITLMVRKIKNKVYKELSSIVDDYCCSKQLTYDMICSSIQKEESNGDKD